MSLDINLTNVQSKPIVVSANQTAENDRVYNVIANATFTDPTGVNGKGYTIFVRNGTATIGGANFGVQGCVVIRMFHSGSWTNYFHQQSLLSTALDESVANKSTNVNTDQASNSKYPSVKAVFDWATNLFFPKPTGTTAQYLRGDGTVATFPTIPDTSDFVEKSDFTSHSILAKQSGASDPVAVSIGNNEILGRKSGGGSNIEGLSVSEVKSLLNYTASDVGAVATNSVITGATKTKISYDAKGLVTSGADATTADIADSSNKRYVTDAQLTVIGNTSNTNTGDETQSTILSKLGFFVNNRTTDSTAVTGTTTETIIDSVLIPANTYSASGGILRLYNSKFAKTGTAGTLRVKIYIGPNAGNLTGATQLADSSSLANTIVYTEMLRTFTVGSATLKGIGSGVVSLTDVVSSNSARGSFAWNPAIDNYLHYTVINGNSADSTVMIGNSVKNF